MNDQLISSILNLLLSSKSHFDYPLWAIQINILESIRVGNYRAYVANGRVVGFINWTFLSLDEIRSVIESGGIMSENLWRLKYAPDANLYIPELIANSNSYRYIHSDIQALFPDCQVAYGLSWKSSEPHGTPRLRRLRRRQG